MAARAETEDAKLKPTDARLKRKAGVTRRDLSRAPLITIDAGLQQLVR
jgi:hypothetical protein